MDWPVDSGRRREEGHVLVATTPRAGFDVRNLRTALQSVDTWRRWDRNARPRHLGVEEYESRRAAQRRVSRHSDMYAKVGEGWDRYAWRTKSRVSMA